MELQEIFDTAVAGVLTQGRQAMRTASHHDGKICALRGDDGSKCAVGFIIPDERYNPRLEVYSQLSDYEHRDDDETYDAALAEIRCTPFGTLLDEIVGMDEPKFRLMLELQSIHDDEDPSWWETLYGELADRWGLAPTVITTHQLNQET